MAPNLGLLDHGGGESEGKPGVVCPVTAALPGCHSGVSAGLRFEDKKRRTGLASTITACIPRGAFHIGDWSVGSCLFVMTTDTCHVDGGRPVKSVMIVDASHGDHGYRMAANSCQFSDGHSGLSS